MWGAAFWALAGNSAASVAQWAAVFFVARLLGYSAAGDYALALAIINPVMAFASMQLRAVQTTDAANRFRFHDLLSVRLWTSLAAALAVVQFGTLTRGSRGVLLSVLALKLVEGLSDVYHAAFQKAGRMDWAAQSVITRSALLIALVISSAWFGQSLALALTAAAAGSALIFLWFDRAQAKHLKLEGAARLLPDWPPQWDSMRSICAAGFPLGVAMMLISLATSMPRFALERFSGREQLGLFATTAALAQILTLVIGALGQSISPALARHAHEGNFPAFRADLARALFVGVAAVIVALAISRLFGPEVLPMFLPGGGPEVATLMSLQLAAAGVSALAGLFGFGLTALGEYRRQLLVFIPLAVISAVLSWTLVPSRGPTGGALAGLSLAGIQWICSYALLNSRLTSLEHSVVVGEGK